MHVQIKCIGGAFSLVDVAVVFPVLCVFDLPADHVLCILCNGNACTFVALSVNPEARAACRTERVSNCGESVKVRIDFTRSLPANVINLGVCGH